MSQINILGDEEVYGELVEGWYWVKLVRPAASWHLKDYIQETKYLDNHLQMCWNDWGLTRSNDPDFVFCNNPLPKYSRAKNYDSVYRMYSHELSGPVELSHHLVESCIKADFNLKKDRLPEWLMNKMYRHLKVCNWKPEEIYDCVSNIHLLNKVST